MKKLLYILILLPLCFNISAQNQDSLKYDIDGKITIRSSEKINDFLNNDEFKYDKEDIKPPESLWQRFWKWVGDLFRLIDRGGKPVSYTFYVIFFAVLLFVIIKLIGLNYQTLFIRRLKIKAPDIEVFDEDIYSLDFDKIISEAVNNRDYRKAVRYLYIMFLKTLTDNEMIEWEINKTNKDYRKEMKKTKYFQTFKNLTFVYEYVWYGEFHINEKQFNNYKNRMV